MDSKRKIDYKKFFKLLFAVFLVSFLLKFVHHCFGWFIFNSDYEQFKIWYPHHYSKIYSLLQAIKVISLVIFGYSIWKFRTYFHELLFAVLTSYNKIENRINQGNEFPLKYPLIYKKYFFIFQISIFIATVSSYYLIQKYSDSIEQFADQLFLSRIYILIAIANFLLFFYINLEFFTAKIKHFLFNPVSPYNLAVYRILFCLILAYYYLVYGFHHIQYIETKPREPLPFIGWLIDIIPITKELYFYACVIGFISCVFLVTGLFTRVFLIINAILIFYIISAPNFYGKLWHSQLPIWISWFLLFAPVSDVFSLDRLWFKKNKPFYKSPNYNFPIKIIWLQLGLIYFWAGFYKLWDVGFEWALGKSMINQVRLEWFEHFDRIPLLRIDKLPVLLYIGGLGVIFFELIFLFLLFHRRLKYISIIGGLIMHNVIGIFMYISFVLLQIQYIAFLNFETILNFLKKRIPSFSYQKNITLIDNSANKKMVVFTCVIFCMNFIFGMSKISSFPFSVYPTYSELIGPGKEYFHYHILNPELSNIDVWDLGRKSNFRWENFTRLEYKIINNFRETGVVDTLAIYNQWSWWTNEMEVLKSADSIDVYIYKRSLNPDSSSVILNKEFIFKMSSPSPK